MPGPSSTATSAPSARARSTSPNRSTFPPPDRGFMIRNGRRGGGVSYSRGPSPGAASAARPIASAATATSGVTTAIQRSPRPAYRTATVTGAATATMPATTRTTPRWVRNHHPAASVSPAPTMPTMIIATLSRGPAATSGSTTATAASRNASRASQRCAGDVGSG